MQWILQQNHEVFIVSINLLLPLEIPINIYPMSAYNFL